MKLTMLLENKKSNDNLSAKHGLSMLIETKEKRILFDMGPNQLFIKNAKQLDVDLKNLDYAIISHGHIDHGGGLKHFLKENDDTKVIIQSDFFKSHYIKFFGIKLPVGVSKKNIDTSRLIYNKKTYKIDDNILVFSHVSNHAYLNFENFDLYKKENKKIILDDFTHEQSMIIHENDKYILISGCAHTGILNIQYTAEQLVGSPMDIVISGFHLFNPTTKKNVSDEMIENVGKSMKENETKYYTCHCTGNYAFNILKEILGVRISYVATGDSLNL